MKHRIALLGSTGSIGEQTLDIVRRHGEHFEITTLTSNNNWERLARQAVEFGADSVVIAGRQHYSKLRDALAGHPVKVYSGEESLNQVISGENIDTVVNALVGYAGLEPTVSALSSGKKVALANKESLVVAGELVMGLAAANKVPLIPVDSEHSAVFQCLAGEVSPPARIILTASGGPFLNTPVEDFPSITPADALKHPNWDMGAKITVDSATMLNKGFEVIEAKWLFGMPVSKIDVLVHPQSVVHSMVEFSDGSIKAQLAAPDMRLPIQYALTYPHRWDAYRRFDFTDFCQFTFIKPDSVKFPSLGLAYAAAETGGNAACILNAANEIAVEAFLAGRIGFQDIPRILENTLESASFIMRPSLDDYRESNAEARGIAVRLTGVKAAE